MQSNSVVYYSIDNVTFFRALNCHNIFFGKTDFLNFHVIKNIHQQIMLLE